MDYTAPATDVARTITRITDMIEQDDLVFALSAVARTLRSDVEHLERALVHELRARGESWATVATALGITRQSAHQRFGDGAPRDTSRDHLYTDR